MAVDDVEVLLPLATLEALEVRSEDGTVRRYSWIGRERVQLVTRPTPRTLQHTPRRTKAAASWSVSGSFLLVIVPSARTLPRALQPSRARKYAHDDPAKDAAADLWRAWAPGPASTQTHATDQIQELDLSGPWEFLGHATLVDYFSDKFNKRRELEAYRHPFDTPPRVERMKRDNYSAWVLKGPDLKVTGAGIEG